MTEISKCNLNLAWSGICYLGTRGCTIHHGYEEELELRNEECARLRKINASLVDAKSGMVIHEARLAEECARLRKENEALLLQFEKSDADSEGSHLYVAYSRAQDECTINNAVFDTYEAARAHADEISTTVGCELVVVKMRHVKGLPRRMKDLSEATKTERNLKRLELSLTEVLGLAESFICQHENTHRGGILWEICDDCGARWADDEGGKPPFVWPEEIERASVLLKELNEPI